MNVSTQLAVLPPINYRPVFPTSFALIVGMPMEYLAIPCVSCVYGKKFLGDMVTYLDLKLKKKSQELWVQDGFGCRFASG